MLPAGYQRRSRLLSLVFLALTGLDAQASDNQELWDFYPSAIGFAQFDGSEQVIAADIVSWENYSAGDSALAGQTFHLEINDGDAEVSWMPTEGPPVLLMASSDWTWHVLFEASFETGHCSFSFDQSLGVRMLNGEEGYRLGQREQLAWTGEPGACPRHVRRYIESSLTDAIMPAHLSDWHSIGGPVAPTDRGRFEMRLWHELRRTRRLLPFDVTADAGADPYEGQLGAIAAAQARYALILARLGPLIFSDRFEIGP